MRMGSCDPDARLWPKNPHHQWKAGETLLRSVEHPANVEAKPKQARWLDGYRVVIARVLREYGDNRLKKTALPD
ncbi:hypothetical protein K6Y76_16830 [Burkholderia cenocepacia]|uniref:hypothetical protein n=1 Tax=Burkholderia cenocepacia TaxID=95486 RepID=UPI0004F7CF85|nr:hypothetical protein [Burkholderia cenocepacia]AIO43891.1 hypothetical protein DM42_6457 [Burkholderia cepacia]KGC05439.1 hypothetical protein DM44_7013 [Burkholderia cepacia]MCG0576817.1 hypothetical protein [Burkholderia cenocepacia]MCW3524476.1 hypothetical protein [Burkholderia cenocepacia]MCW3614698.1 hypothetical protein [Burkholderia cenocepacia]